MTKEEVIITAAMWWTDKLRKRQPHDNGDNSRESAFANLFADLLATPATEAQLNVFERALTVGIEEEYKKYLEDRTFPSIHIGCDYSPDNVLTVAAYKAGISIHNFPYKTHMLISKNEVQVADGYGTPYMPI